MRTPGIGERRLLSIVKRDKLRRVLEKMLDEKEEPIKKIKKTG